PARRGSSRTIATATTIPASWTTLPRLDDVDPASFNSEKELATVACEAERSQLKPPPPLASPPNSRTTSVRATPPVRYAARRRHEPFEDHHAIARTASAAGALMVSARAARLNAHH